MDCIPFKFGDFSVFREEMGDSIELFEWENGWLRGYIGYHAVEMRGSMIFDTC